MSDSDLIKLYSGRILELAASIPHQGRLSEPMGSAKKRSPSEATAGAETAVAEAVVLAFAVAVG